MAGKSRLLATRKDAGRLVNKNSWCFSASILGFSFVDEIFSAHLTMHYIHKDSHIYLF